MSEYQSYEFLALDRRLTAQEMAELCSISTRAEITPTRFWNEYQWGDLKADPSELLARYFLDLHLYCQLETRRLMFPLPATAVDLDALGAYAPGGPVTLTTTGEHAVLDLWSEVDEPEDDWFGGASGVVADAAAGRAAPRRPPSRVPGMATGSPGRRGRRSDSGAAGATRPRHRLGPIGGPCRLPAFRSGPARSRGGIEAEARDEPGQFRAWVKSLLRRRRSGGCCGQRTTRTCRWGRSCSASPSGASTGDRPAATDGDAVAGTRGESCAPHGVAPLRSEPQARAGRCAEQAACGARAAGSSSMAGARAARGGEILPPGHAAGDGPGERRRLRRASRGVRLSDCRGQAAPRTTARFWTACDVPRRPSSTVRRRKVQRWCRDSWQAGPRGVDRGDHGRLPW